MKLMTTTSLFLITYQTQRIRETLQHTILGVKIVLILEKQKDTASRGIGYMVLVKKHSEESLT